MIVGDRVLGRVRGPVVPQGFLGAVLCAALKVRSIPIVKTVP